MYLNTPAISSLKRGSDQDELEKNCVLLEMNIPGGEEKNNNQLAGVQAYFTDGQGLQKTVIASVEAGGI